MTRLLSLLAALAIALPVAGCGQKGPLYLPGNPSAVQVSPERAPAEDPDDGDEDEDEEDEDSVNQR